jgi:branched-chain amino acid aminotransferase
MSALSDNAAGHQEWIWRNGEILPWERATVHVNAVGHASVAAIFEGIKAYLAADGRRLLLFRLDDHLRRLYASARICRLRLPFGHHELRPAVLALLTANGCDRDTYVRPWAFPAGIVREPMVPADATCEMAIDCWPFTSELLRPRGCRAMVSSWVRIADASTPPRVKAFSNYHNGRLAVIEARANGHDWPVLLNQQGKVSEGAGSCVGLVRGGTLITPSFTSDVLESVTRATALELAHRAGVPADVREVDRSELYLADELFFMGTGWEILPITEIDGLTVGNGKIGPVTEFLESRYSDLIRGNLSEYSEWLTEVAIEKRGRADAH